VLELPCQFFRVKKTEGMGLSQEEGRRQFLAAVIRKTLPNLGDEEAFHLAYILLDIRMHSEHKRLSIEEIVKRFDEAKTNTTLGVYIFPRFLRTLQQWTSVPLEILRACHRDEDIPILIPSRKEELWKSLFPDPDYTAEYRFAWAEKQVAEARQADLVRRPKGQLSLNRYEPGTAYGNLYFIRHPYEGFPDHQIWMTPDGRLFLINERECLIEAFRQGVVSAAPMVALAWGMVAVGALVGTTLAAGPALVEAPAAIKSAGYNISIWYLRNPIEATPLLCAAAEVAFSITTGEETPPVGPADEIAFVAVRGTKQVIKAGRRFLIRMTDEAVAKGAGKWVLRGKVVAGEMVSRQTAESTFDLLKNEWLVARIHPIGAVSAAETALVKALPGLSSYNVRKLFENLSRLKKRRGLRTANAVLKRLMGSKDKTVLEATERFGAISGYERVLLEALSASKTKQQGAKFVMEYALAGLPKDAASKAMYFELRSVWRVAKDGRRVVDETTRFVDIWLEGYRYELKSVKRITSRLVKGKKGQLGQLQRDLIKVLGVNEKEAFANLKKVKWVFDSRRLPKKYFNDPTKSAEEIIRGELIGWLKESRPFKWWGKQTLDKLEKALDDFVVVWPPRS
jgi:hypothetical protein